MTQAVYDLYGGQQSDNMSTTQFNSILLMAEQRVTKYIGTFLLPTIVTGTFSYHSSHFIVTDYGYVSSILSAKVLSTQGSATCTLASDSGCAYIFEDTFGYLNYSCVQSVCNCAQWQSPYQFQVAYQAGLPTGTANQPGILHALTIVAELALNEIVFPRQNETAGDRGITEWKSLDYSEKRKDWAVTALGSSSRAGLAADLIKMSIRLARPAILLR